MNKEDILLPIGSVITSKAVKLEIRKKTYLVITGRFYSQDIKKKKYFDYECNYYPGGALDGTKLYLNHDYIDEVVHMGFQDEKDINFQKAYLKLIKEKGFKKVKQKGTIETAKTRDELE